MSAILVVALERYVVGIFFFFIFSLFLELFCPLFIFGGHNPF